MKKTLLLLFSALAIGTALRAQPAGCGSPVNLVANPDFETPGAPINTGLALNAACTSGPGGTYTVNTNLNLKCGSWINTPDNTSGAGSFLIFDGHPTAGVDLWRQNVTVCPNTNYTFSYWTAGAIPGGTFNIDCMVNGVVVGTTAVVAGPVWVQSVFVWNSGATAGVIQLVLRQQTGGGVRDGGIDDIFFGYCGTVVNSASICQGGCTVLTASGGTGPYTRSTGATTTSITVCPPATTTYTVTTDPTGCLPLATATATVTVNPVPVISATASPSTLTPPATTTSFISTSVTGGSGFTYSWSPAAGLSSTTVANPVATPTVTTTYTLVVTNSAGCSATTTVTVTVNPQCLCTLTYDYDLTSSTSTSVAFPSLTGLTHKNIRVNGTLTIDGGGFNFSGCNIVMLPGSSIQTTSGSILYITDRTHIFSCDGMWNGITLVSGSSAQIKNASIIEDAIRAVKIDQGATAQVEFCVFNRNYTAVEVTANTSATSPLSMLGCVVTSRDISFNCNTTLNPDASTVWTNIVAGAYSSINMKTPFHSYKSIYGVLATDVNALDVGSDLYAYFFNGFDNLASTGVHLTRTNAKVRNNQFRTITNAPTCLSCTPLLGMGVYATGSTTANYTLIVGGAAAFQPNTFTDIYASVESVNYQLNSVRGNTITNSTTSSSMFGAFGNRGIKITPMSGNMVRVSENTITNCITGIWVNRNNANAINANALWVDYNSISANASGFCTNAIQVTDYAPGTTVVPTSSQITFNTIVESANCINLSNVKKPLSVLSNSCMVRYQAGGNTNGIKAINCQNVTIQQNRVKHNAATGGAFGGNILTYGIYLKNSPGMIVKCNIIQDAARSLVFEDGCLSPHGITQNTFRSTQEAFVLLNAAAVIGQQGTAGAKSDNIWDLTTTIPVHVRTLSTTPLDLYVTWLTSGATETEPFSFAGTGTINVFASGGGTPAACGPVPARLMSPEAAAAQENNAITISPNPTSGSFVINTVSEEAKDIFVYDMTGKLVFSQSQVTGTTTYVDITGQPAGIYMVRVVNGNSVETQNIIKQ